MTKNEIRKKILLLRNHQSQRRKNKKDASILAKLFKRPEIKNAKEIFTYISHKGEVSTDSVLQKFIGNKKIIVPKMENGGICLYELKEATKFKKGQFGIREPEICLPKKELGKIEVAIVPAVAFDECGHRIGYGGGHFDRLLGKLNCAKIGLAYEFQIIDKVPVHNYDVPVDLIITEKRTIMPKLSSCERKDEKNRAKSN